MSSAAGPSVSKKTSKKAQVPAAPVSRSVVNDSSDESGSESDASRSSSPEVRQVASSSKHARQAFQTYEPPAGMEPVGVSVTFKDSPFEFDALANKPGVKLWAIRIPSDLKPSRLSSLAISAMTDSEIRGDLTTKSGTFKLGTVDVETGTGAEMKGMSLLVPQVRRSGKLYRSPIDISQHLILTPVESLSADSGSMSFTAPPKAKRTQPEHLLKFRNRAYGFDTSGPEATTTTTADDDSSDEADQTATPAASQRESEVVPAESASGKKSDKESKKSSDKESKRKKRKSDVDGSSPAKKKKKVKE